MKAYYAHCLHIYGTPQELRDIQTLQALGFDVINPNSPEIEAKCKEIRDVFGRDSSDVMRMVFKPIAQTCDVLAFRALPDGRIPAGVAKEIEWAREFSRPVIELPAALHDRTMSVESTRAYLQEVGQR